MADIPPNKPIEPAAATKPINQVTSSSPQLPAGSTAAVTGQTIVIHQVLTTLPSNQSNILQLDQGGHYFIEAKNQAGQSVWFRSNTPWPNNSVLQVSLPQPGNQLALEQVVKLPSTQQQLQQLGRLLDSSQHSTTRQGQVLDSAPIPHLKASIPLGEGGNRLLPILLNQANQVFWLNTDQPILPGQVINLYRGSQGIHLQSLPYQQIQWLTLNQALHQSVTSSIPIHQALKQLTHFIRDNQPQLGKLSKAVNHLLTQLPTLKQLTTPQQLSQWLSNSGLFFESRLSNFPELRQQVLSSPHDLKGSLLQLIKLLSHSSNQPEIASNHLKPSPWTQLYKASAPPLSHLFPWLTSAPVKTNSQPELANLLKQAVYRLQSNQLMSLQPTLATPTADAPVNQQWQLEIPLFVQGQWQSIQLELQKQHSQQKDSMTNETEVLWQFQLSFDLPPIGPLYARVKLSGNTASATFWAEQQATCDVVREHLNELQQALSDRGIDVEVLNCRHGSPTRQNTFIEQHLIDITT